MGFIGAAVKAGIAKKVWNEARKPQNQAKAKELFSKLTGKGGGSGGTAATGRARRPSATTRRR